MNKIRVMPVSSACECPFYVEDTAGVRGCFFKKLTNANVAAAMVANDAYDTSEWDAECGGEYAACSILPLLWELNAEESQEEEIEERAVDSDEGAEKYNEEQVDDEEEGNDVGEEEIAEPTVNVSIHQVTNPYQVKGDVLVYPTNNLLTIDDPLLNRMSRGMIQAECDSVQRPIKMGHVYATSNGGEKSAVKSKAVFHAVVAGPSRLVNEQDMKSALRKSLRLAEDMGAKNVVMLPCDCGTHDINDAARVQLAAIQTFLQTHKTENLQNIFVVMEDEDSLEVFKEYFERIFE